MTDVTIPSIARSGSRTEKERWIAAKGLVIFDRTGAAARFIGTVLDITPQKQSELELQRAKQEAEDANRAKDHFLAMLSHELRTPLTPVLMTIASLRRDPTLSDELLRDLEMLQRNIELEALLIDDLLDLTRIAHGKLELHSTAVDLHALIEHALKIAEGDSAGRRLEVVRQLEAKHFHTWGDAARLQQVFWNLVKNAVKFTPPGGKIEIVTRNLNPTSIEIVVRDDGVGIEPRAAPADLRVLRTRRARCHKPIRRARARSCDLQTSGRSPPRHDHRDERRSRARCDVRHHIGRDGNFAPRWAGYFFGGRPGGKQRGRHPPRGRSRRHRARPEPHPGQVRARSFPGQ